MTQKERSVQLKMILPYYCNENNLYLKRRINEEKAKEEKAKKQKAQEQKYEDERHDRYLKW